MFDEQKIREIVREEVQSSIERSDTQNQFAVSQTPFHTHNKVDSNAIPFTNLKDVPASYYGKAGNLVQVASSENGLEFTNSPTISGSLTVSGNLNVQGSTNLIQSTVAQSINAISLQIGVSQVYKGIYCGAVTSGGAAGTPFPSGWTVTKNATGDYTVTHNLALGSDTYVVVANVISGGKIAIISARNTNNFNILTQNNSGTGTDTAFNFIMLVLQ